MPNNCPKCFAAVDADAVFCELCGSPILLTVHCPKCGKNIVAEAKFCKYCAFDLSQPINSAATADPDFTAPHQPAQAAQSQAVLQPDNAGSFISPAGAAFAVLCFFMPWAGFSACGINKDVSGSDIAGYDGSFWLVPLMGIVSVGTYFFFKNQKMLFKARPFIIGCSAFALLFLFYKYNSIPSGPNVLGYQVSASDFGIQLRFGSMATIIGFILAMVGCIFMSRAIVSADRAYSTNSPPGTQKYNDAITKDITAAVLSYLAPLLLPIVVGFITLAMAKTVSGGEGIFIIVFLLNIVISPFVVQIAYLNVQHYKKIPFVRFHAYQALFLQLVNYGFQLLGLGIMLLSRKSSNPTFPSSGAQVVSVSTPPLQEFFGIWGMGLTISVWIVSIVISVKAYKLEFFKLPVIGDWAMKQANKILSIHDTPSWDKRPESVPDSMRGFQPKRSSSASEAVNPEDMYVLKIIGGSIVGVILIVLVIWILN